MEDIQILLVVYGVSCVLLIGFSIPLIMKKVKPNPWYGFRVPKTLNNPEIWYPANAYAGRALLISSLVTLLAAILIRLVPGITVDGYTLAVSLVIVVSLGVALFLSFRYLRQL